MDTVFLHWNTLHVNLISLKYLLNYALEVNTLPQNKKKVYYRYQLVNKLLFELQKSSIAKQCQENNIKKGYALFKKNVPNNQQINKYELDSIIKKLINQSIKLNDLLNKDHEEYRNLYCKKVRSYLLK